MNWQTLLAIDSDRWAAETYRANFPGVRVECGPVQDYLDKLPDSDVILGGPPCQPFSDAGENEGEEDERDCIPDFCEAVERKRPRMFLMENVRGLLKQRHLPYFGRVLARLEAADYVVEWRLLDAVSFGVPQFRERVWIWGIRSDLYRDGVRHCWPKPTHTWPPPDECMFGAALLPGITVRQALGLTVQVKAHIGHGSYDWGVKEISDEPSVTITGQTSDTQPRAFCTGGGLFIQSHADPARTVDAPSPTLRSGGEGHDGCCVRLHVIPPRQNGCPEQFSIDEPSRAISASRADEWKLAVRGGGTNPHYSGEARTDRDITDEPSTTIAAQHTHNALPEVVARRWSDAMLAKQPPIELDQPCPTIVKNWHKGVPYGALKWKQDETGLWIRRLHPLECARLQSVDDSFVWLPEMPKSAAYKVVGNGWASRMGAVFADAFATADPDSRTVVDLFCGGGLGAVGWHGRAWSYATQAKGRVTA